MEVRGLTAAVYRVSVTLSNLNHSQPDDLDVLMVGPGGQAVWLMSDAGGANAVSGVSLTFEEAAALTLPDAGALVSGRLRPGNFDPASDTLPAPAPSGAHGTALSQFTGTDPNGFWSLYVFDDRDGASGGVAGGWSLDLSLLEPMADLAVRQIPPASPVAVGSNLLYTLVVTNQGPLRRAWPPSPTCCPP